MEMDNPVVIVGVLAHGLTTDNPRGKETTDVSKGCMLKLGI